MNGSPWTNPARSRCRSFQGLEYALGVAMGLILAPFLLGQANEGRPSSAPAEETPQITTGPEVGQKIPGFRAPDQNGRVQDFNSIRGPQGALIVFNRSADW